MATRKNTPTRKKSATPARKSEEKLNLVYFTDEELANVKAALLHWQQVMLAVSAYTLDRKKMELL